MKKFTETRETLLENKHKTRKVNKKASEKEKTDLFDAVHKNRKKRIDSFK